MMMNYEVFLERQDSHGSVLSCKDAELAADTDANGRTDAFNPAELLLAALAGCIAKGIERVAPMLQFSYTGLCVTVRGERQDTPPRMSRIEYAIEVTTGENDHRLELLHENVKKYGTVYNTLAASVHLSGTLARAND